MNLPSYPVLQFICRPTQDGRPSSRRLTAAVLTLYLLGILLTSYDGSIFFPDARIGFAEDYANYFYMAALGISVYFAVLLLREFRVIFQGGVEEVDRLRGIVPLIDESRVNIEAYAVLVKRRMRTIRGETWGAKTGIRVIRSLFLIVFLGYSFYAPLNAYMPRPGTWNFSFYPYWLSLQSYASQGLLVENPQFFYGFLYNQIKDFLVYVVLLPPVVWIVGSVAWSAARMLKLLSERDALRIEPSFPDQSGGLRPIGNLALLLFYIVIVQFIHILPTMIIQGVRQSDQVIFLPYFFFAAFVFFYPLSSVHRVMKTRRQSTLEQLSAMLHERYRQMHNQSGKRRLSMKRVAEQSESIRQLKELYQEAHGMHVWPFAVETFVKFLTAWIVPIVLFLLQDYLLNMLRQP